MRRGIRHAGLFVVREHPLGRTPPAKSGSDYQLLQMAERQVDVPNRISDAVIYDLLLEMPAVSKPAKQRAYAAAIKKYGHALPADMIRRYVDATLLKLSDDHRKMLRARAEAEVERKAKRRRAA